MTRSKPGPGWTKLGSGVYEHSTGVRIHLLGLARIPGKNRYGAPGIARVFDKPHRATFARIIKEQGGNHRRAMMIWALTIAPRSTPSKQKP